MKKRTLIITAIAVAIVAVTGGTALAKGPESATFSGPGINGPTELNQNDPVIGQLMQQSGIWNGPGVPLSSAPTGDLGPVYTLTWVNSGPPDAPIAERTIRQFIYPQAENGPVIHTPVQDGLEGWGPDVVGWFEASDGLIHALLTLGVPAPAPLGEADTVAAAESESGAVAANSAGQIVSVDSESDYLIYLAIAGLGLVLALTWASRRRTSA
jgi:hypothetical protein